MSAFSGIAISLFLGSVIHLSLKRQKIEQPAQYRRKKTALWLLLGLLILLPLCSVATYTWFSISRTPKVSDMEMTINSNVGLELAWSPDVVEEEWGQHLVFTDAVPDNTLLTPVTWSDKNGGFYAVTFGTDGRVKGIGTRLSDEKDTNDPDGHYAKFTLYGRTHEHVDVSLAPAIEMEEGTACAGTYLICPPRWDADGIRHTVDAYGAQYAVRLGLRITKLSAANGTEGDSTFFVYEPNSDGHVDGTTGYVPTASIDGTDTLVPTDRLILQSTSSFSENVPVLRDTVQYDLGDFEGEASLFELTPDEMVKIEVYVWLEGMDADCVNAIGRGALIVSNLQFLAEPHHMSGLKPVK